MKKFQRNKKAMSFFLHFLISMTAVQFSFCQNNYDKFRLSCDQYLENQKYDSALNTAKELSAWALENEKDSSFHYAESLRYIGQCFQSMKKYDSAIFFYNESLTILAHQKRELHPETSKILNSLGVVFKNMENYTKAEYYYKKALEILETNKNQNEGLLARIMSNLGFLYYLTGDYKNAVTLNENALEIKMKIYDENNPSIAYNTSMLGLLSRILGDYQAAENYFKSALNTYKKKFGENNVDYAGTLDNLAGVYSSLGDYKSSILLSSQSLEINRKLHRQNSVDYAGTLQNLAIAYQEIGDYISAEENYIKAVNIFRDQLGGNDPTLAITINNLGVLYDDAKKFTMADSCYRLALKIRTQALGTNHPDNASSLENLGAHYFDIHDYENAEKYYNQALEIRKSAFSENHPGLLSLNTNIAFLLLNTGRSKLSYSMLENVFGIKKKVLVDNFEWLDDNQKELYWKKESRFYEKLSWFAHLSYTQVPASVGLNYNAALFAKSKLLEAKISSENYYRDVDELRDALAYRRRLLAKMESEGSGEKDEVDKLRLEADSLDKRLTLSWPEYAQQKKNLSVDWEQVQQNLEPGEAALEFVRFKNEEDSLYYYNALLLRRGDSMPRLIPLCREADLKNIQLRSGYSRYYAKLWQPLEEHLDGIRTIYYSPVGLLNNIPFGALYPSTGKEVATKTPSGAKRGGDVEEAQTGTVTGVVYLMDRYKLHQLTSTRYLALGLKKQASNPVSKSMLLAGGINYDYLPGNPAKPDLTKVVAVKTNGSRGSAAASSRLAFLPGTRQEIEQIGVSLSASTWNSEKLENNDATEENIIKYEGKEAKGVMHLATHGYAFEEYDFNDSSISKHSLRYSYRYSKNPMVRSGLILSGGNWAWTGSDTLSKLGATQNGILTALEVSQLNLRKTKLVVLSACETGLGKIEGSEGTFGLKRAFKLAGVEQLIVSLWSVPDKETKELMGAFYADLASSLNPVASFEKAQQSMRIRYPQQPEKWAGFVLVR